jgi:sugar phosphate isomerase/epimerase
MIYTSTGGYSDLTFEQTINLLCEFDITAYELSSGQYCENLEETLSTLARKFSLTLHNYFPPPKLPFVFNLASLNEQIGQKSIEHAKGAIDLSAKLNSKYYSFHAGYLIDPHADELGKPINRQTVNCRQEGLAVFIDRVNQLAAYAAKKDVQLLIENNVLSDDNYLNFKCDPLLMTGIEETRQILAKTISNVSLLIDVAHLKVSANTLKFSAHKYLEEFKHTATAYHLSDNQGLADTNDPITHKSWFWPLINRDLDYYSLEIYNASPKILKSQLELAQEYIT